MENKIEIHIKEILKELIISVEGYKEPVHVRICKYIDDMSDGIYSGEFSHSYKRNKEDATPLDFIISANNLATIESLVMKQINGFTNFSITENKSFKK